MDEQLLAISRALEVLERRLFEEITVEDLAAASGYSLFHFARTFNRLVHHTPYDYLTRRRLSESARWLASTRRRVVDIGMDAGFHSPETFARAFKRMFGLQPSQVRAGGALDPRLLFTPRTPRHLEHIRAGDFLHPARIELPSLCLAGLMTRLRAPAAAADLWSALAGESGTGGTVYGVTSYPEDWSRNGVFYFAGVPLGEGQPVPLALVSRDLPGGSWAGFEHRAPPEKLPLTRDYVYQTWLPRAGHGPGGTLEVEIYADGFPGRGCILAVPLGV